MKTFKNSFRKSALAPFKNKDGNVAIITAIALPSVIMFSFGAIDYGIAVQAQQELNAAATAAALAGVNEAHMAFTSRENVNLEELVEVTTRNVFDSRLSSLTGTQIDSYDIKSKVINNVFTVEVKYKARVKSHIASVVGYDYFPVSDTSRARAAARSYINFNFVFDVSGSMGVGATPADQERLHNAIGCAFACHINRPRGTSPYDTAVRIGAKTRIDVAREAADGAFTIIENNSESDNHMTVGMHIYDNRTIEISDFEDPKAADFDFLRNSLKDVQLTMTHGGSNTQNAIANVVAKLPPSGTGRTPDDRLQYVILLTDGIDNTVYWNDPNNKDPNGTGRNGWDRFLPQNPVAPVIGNPNGQQVIFAPSENSCDSAKAKNIGVFFINTEYLIPEIRFQGHGSNGDHRFQKIEADLNDITLQRMKLCAGSDDHVIKASTPDQIVAAFKNIIGDLSSPLRLY